MPLMCECIEYDGDGWYWQGPTEKEYMRPRGKRCCSCGTMVRKGDTGVVFPRYRAPRSDIEESIYCDEVPLAGWWMCEECGDLFWALDDLGFCISLGSETMRELAAEYAATYGPQRAA